MTRPGQKVWTPAGFQPDATLEALCRQLRPHEEAPERVWGELERILLDAPRPGAALGMRARAGPPPATPPNRGSCGTQKLLKFVTVKNDGQKCGGQTI